MPLGAFHAGGYFMLAIAIYIICTLDVRWFDMAQVISQWDAAFHVRCEQLHFSPNLTQLPAKIVLGYGFIFFCIYILK